MANIAAIYAQDIEISCNPASSNKNLLAVKYTHS